VKARKKYNIVFDPESPSGDLGVREIENLAINNEHTDTLQRMRVKLYDFLWHNVSFEHLFHRRLDQTKMKSIAHNRFHSPHPHHRLHPRHFYSHLSEFGRETQHFSTISGLHLLTLANANGVLNTGDGGNGGGGGGVGGRKARKRSQQNKEKEQNLRREFEGNIVEPHPMV